MDASNSANIVHYSVFKSKRITDSVLAAELFAVVHAFDYAPTVHLAVSTLFEELVEINATTEKRLIVDLTMPRQAYERNEIADVVWIPSAQNPAGAMSKENASSAFKKLIDDSTVDISLLSWAEKRALEFKDGKKKHKDGKCIDQEAS